MSHLGFLVLSLPIYLVMKSITKVSIVKILSENTEPLPTKYIQEQIGASNWMSVNKHLLELVISGDISGIKTRNGWFFWIDPEVNA